VSTNGLVVDEAVAQCNQKAGIFLSPIEILYVQATTQKLTRCTEACEPDDRDCAGFVTLDRHFQSSQVFTIFETLKDSDVDAGARCKIPFRTAHGKAKGFRMLDFQSAAPSVKTAVDPNAAVVPVNQVAFHPNGNAESQWENLLLQGLVKFCCPSKVEGFMGKAITFVRAVGHVLGNYDWASRWKCTQNNYDDPSTQCCDYLHELAPILQSINMAKKDYYYFFPGSNSAHDAEFDQHARHYIYISNFQCRNR